MAELAGINKQGNGPVVSGWVNPVFMVIQATIAGGSGAVTIDAVASSPGTAISRSDTGQYDITYPKAKRFHYVSGEVMLAEAAGSKLSLEAYDPKPTSGTVGTASFEAAITPGTAADPATLSRLFITFLLERG